MKKLLSLALLLALTLSLAACSSNPAANSIAGEPSELMKTIIEKVDTDEDTKAWLTDSMQETVLSAENNEYFLGKADYSYQSAVALEPMMSSQAFSLVLIRANSPEEATKLSEEVKTTVDPRKWICVGVDPEDVQTAVIGDLMLLVMAEDSQIYIDAFNKLAA